MNVCVRVVIAEAEYRRSDITYHAVLLARESNKAVQVSVQKGNDWMEEQGGRERHNIIRDRTQKLDICYCG